MIKKTFTYTEQKYLCIYGSKNTDLCFNGQMSNSLESEKFPY